MVFFSITGLYCLSQVYKLYGMQKGDIDDMTLTWAGSIGSIANGAARVFWGIQQDKYGFKFVYNCILIMEVIVMIFLVTEIASHTVIYFILVVIGFFCLGGHFVIFATAIIDIYGLKAGAQIYSIILVAKSGSALLMTLMIEVLYEKYGSDAYQMFFTWSIGSALISAAILNSVFD